MLENGKPRETFEADGLHMTAKGYAVRTPLVRAALLPDVEAEARRCRTGAAGGRDEQSFWLRHHKVGAGAIMRGLTSLTSRILLLAALATALGAAHATDWPYDEKADASADIHRALGAARTDHKDVLLVFGANWCGDCRALDKAMHGSSQRLIAGKFHVVKIDVGNFDKNLELAQRYGNPIEKGIPAVVLLSADNHVVYSTRGGELAVARKMGDLGIYDFLSQKVASGSVASK
jgi:thioredoxin 1